MKNYATGLIVCLTTALIAGCGKPPAGRGGPPDDFSVQAVIAPANAETVKVVVKVVGSLQARDVLDIVSEISAPVSEILFTEGELVKEGQILARLDDAKLKARLAEVKARRELAETNFKRAEDLYASETISRQDYDQVKSEFEIAEAGLNLLSREVADTVIKAPFPGVVGERMVSAGQYVTAGQALTKLVRLDPLEASFRIPERYVGQIKMNQAITMRSVALPDTDINGEVFFIDPSIDEQSRTILAKARIPNPENKLKPGLFGGLDVVLEERTNAVVVPESSVRYAGDQASVVVMNGESRAEFRDVIVGQRMPGRVEIVEGLQAGERVVVEGYQKMGPGTGILISPASEKYGISPPPVETAPVAAGEQGS